MSDERGMVPREQWAQTDVHKASAYACGKCGDRFATPHDVYAHLDVEHPKKKEKKRAR
jgi:hypothetical protein